MKTTELASLAVKILLATMLSLALFNLLFEFEVVEWPSWLPFTVHLRVVGSVYVLAAIAEVCAPKGWGRGLFAILFGGSAFFLLFGEVTGGYPPHRGVLAGPAALLSFGALHLSWKMKHLLE